MIMLVNFMSLLLSLLVFCYADQVKKRNIIGEDDENLPTNLCYGLKSSGVADIIVKNKTMRVWCDVESAGGPWITFLKRYDGSTDFDRLFDDYKNGFGDVNGEYWLGLDNIHLLTESNEAKLRIDIVYMSVPDLNIPERPSYAIYDKFRVGNESTDYTLEEFSGYSGNAGDIAQKPEWTHEGYKFSTRDKDFDDKTDGNCAADYSGGWWFRNCYGFCLTCGPWSETRDNPKRPPPGYGVSAVIEAAMKVNLPKSMLGGDPSLL